CGGGAAGIGGSGCRTQRLDSADRTRSRIVERNCGPQTPRRAQGTKQKKLERGKEKSRRLVKATCSTYKGVASYSPGSYFVSSNCFLISSSAKSGTTSHAISRITLSDINSTHLRAIASIIAGDSWSTDDTDEGADFTSGSGTGSGSAIE